MNTIDRARIVEDMALMIARHRMGDRLCLLTAAEIVTQADRAIALHLARMSAPLHPLPDPTPQDLPDAPEYYVDLIPDKAVKKRAAENTTVDERADGSKRATLPCPFCGAGGFIAFNVPKTARAYSFSVTAMCGECGKSRDCTISCDPETQNIKVEMHHERPGHA